jgi:hypothetical protein
MPIKFLKESYDKKLKNKVAFKDNLDKIYI